MSQLPNSAVVDFGSSLGVLSFHEDAKHVVYLFEVRRKQSNLIFEFRSTAPGLVNRALSFSRDITSEDYVTEYSQSLATGTPFSLSESACVDDEIWEGYMVSGSMRELVELLSSDGMKLKGDANDAIVEQALNRNLVGSYARSINLANADRTRAENPVNCSIVAWPFTIAPMYINRECMIGPIRWKEGFNCVIDQSNFEKSITINAEVGGGAGEPCDEVPLFATEVAPAGDTLLTGGPTCNEVIRSINGVGGRVVDILTGRGVSVTSSPGNNLIIVDIDTNDLAVCFDGVDPDEISCESISASISN